jgi:hypothetical protein
MLNLAISTMAGRAKTKYGIALMPDEALSDPAQVVERAVAWLQTGTWLRVRRGSGSAA